MRPLNETEDEYERAGGEPRRGGREGGGRQGRRRGGRGVLNLASSHSTQETVAIYEFVDLGLDMPRT